MSLNLLYLWENHKNKFKLKTNIMSKEKDSKKNNKKAPEKTLKEKRLAREAKRRKKNKKSEV